MTTTRQILDSPDFHTLVRRRWRVSALLSVALFVLYYGYVILIAANKAFLARRLSGATTIGIPIGAAVIIGAWALTAIYVLWANRYYDREVARLRGQL